MFNTAEGAEAAVPGGQGQAAPWRRQRGARLRAAHSRRPASPGHVQRRPSAPPRCPRADGSGSPFPSRRRGPSRAGPAPPPLPAGGGARGRALGKVCLCGWLRGSARPVGAGGRLRALAGQREASGRRSPGRGRRGERVRRPPSASRRERHPPAWGSAGRGRPACSRSSCCCCCCSVSPGALGGGRGRAVLGRR